MTDSEINFSIENADGDLEKLEHSKYPSFFSFKFEESHNTGRTKTFVGNQFTKSVVSISDVLFFVLKPNEDSTHLKAIKFNASMLKLAKETPELKLKKANNMVVDVSHTFFRLCREDSISDSDAPLVSAYLSQSENSIFSLIISLAVSSLTWNQLLSDYETNKLAPQELRISLDNLLSVEPENDFSEKYAVNEQMYWGSLLNFHNSNPFDFGRKVENNNSASSIEVKGNKDLVESVEGLSSRVGNLNIVLLAQSEFIKSSFKYVICALVAIAIIIATK